MWVLMREYMHVSRRAILSAFDFPSAVEEGVWSTRGEIRAALAYIRLVQKKPAQIVYVSGRYHLPRIWLLARMLSTSSEFRRSKFVAAPGDASNLKLCLHEMVAIPLNVLKLALGR
jgi:uncharacterized SAM-binding protein YcdF (DUF218 family)